MSIISSKTKIGLLVAGHVVGGHLPALVGHDIADKLSPMFIGLFALAFAQAGLLGTWGALGTSRSLWRLPGVFATTGYVCALAITAVGAWQVGIALVEVYLSVALPAVAVFLVLSILRHSRYKLHLERPSLPASRGGQFTIRHLLLATAAIAIVLAIGRELRTVSPGDGIERECMIVTYLTLCVFTVDLAVLWGTLGIKRSTPRLAIVLPSAFVTGVIPTFFLETLLSLDWKDHVTWSCIMGLQATIMAASLLVVRSCRWRLVSGTGEQGENLPTPPGP